MSWTEQEVEKAFMEVKKKAMTDREFRSLLLTDPHRAIEQVTGKEVPSEFAIKVIESDPAYDMTFVLPEKVTEELSDEMLDSVAGGVIGCVGVGSVAAGACAGEISIGPCGMRACMAAVRAR
jgi:hypothetical protein